MKRILILAALLTAALVSGAQTLCQNGTVLNGPSVVVQKPVYGEFRNGELTPFVNHTTVRIELRENTARGSVVTVTKRHPVLGKELLKRIESRDGLEVTGDAQAGWVVMDSSQVWLRLDCYGTIYVVDWE